ncbi:MAG: hypothetical protein AAF366_05735 [Pseudomonadota bacterium]
MQTLSWFILGVVSLVEVSSVVFARMEAAPNPVTPSTLQVAEISKTLW